MVYFSYQKLISKTKVFNLGDYEKFKLFIRYKIICLHVLFGFAEALA